MQIDPQNEKRRAAILRILQHHRVARQSGFIGLLAQEGIVATQSSISRDLRELGVRKLADGYHLPAEPADDEAVVAQLVRDVKTAGPNLTVIRTDVGGAQRVAVYLDRADWPEAVGTVSGDDTIFVATEGATGQRRLIERLERNLGSQAHHSRRRRRARAEP